MRQATGGVGATDGFAQIPRALLECPGLSATAKLLYACVQSHANAEGVAWPSIERLAAMTGWERKKVMRGLSELVVAGWLERQRRGRTEVNAYAVMYHQGTSRSPTTGLQRFRRIGVTTPETRLYTRRVKYRQGTLTKVPV